MEIKRNLMALACLSAMSITSVQAGPPHRPDLVNDGNRWEVTGYFDAAPGHAQAATQGICFFFAGVNGTQQLYNWVSDTFPDWNGRASQEGDQVFMHGDYDKNRGHDGIEWEITTASPKNVGYGHWKEWRENGNVGTTIAFGNAKFRRVGRCRQKGLKETLQRALELQPPVNKFGSVTVSPVGYTAEEIQRLTDIQ